MAKVKDFFKKHWTAFRTVTASLMLVSWFIGYYANGLYHTNFDLGSIWQGLGILALDTFRHFVNSKYNSPMGQYPYPGEGN